MSEQLGNVLEILDSLREPINATERESRRGPYPYYGANGQAGTIDEYRFDGDYVLLAEDGGNFDDPSRGVAYRATGKFWVNNHAHVLRPICGMETQFVVHALNSFNWMPFVSGTTRLKLNQEKMRSAPFPLPPLNEQRRIVAQIEALQARSRKAREALAEIPTLLEQYRQSVLAAAFRGDLTADWRVAHPDVEPASVLLERIRKERRERWLAANPKKTYVELEPVDESELPELPEGWCWASLESLSWSSGYGTSTKCDFEGGGQAVFRIPNVSKGRIDDSDLKFSLSPLNLPDEELIDAGDFLIIRTNGSRELIGRGAIVAKRPARDSYFASYLIRYRLTISTQLGPWLSVLWDSPEIRKRLESFAATSAGQYNVSLGKLDHLPIPLPPLDEMAEIVRVVSSSTSRIQSHVLASVRESQRDIDSLDQVILAKAFRGELVPQDPNDEPAALLLERIRAEREAAPAPRRKRAATLPTREERVRTVAKSGKSLSDGQLAAIVRRHSSPVSVDELRSATTLSVPEFYAALKQEIEGGVIRERVSSEGVRFLELRK